ncbi:MAG TPA: EutN/CcmL family microcompartment protein [Candidatus Eisenbacteria bacterium]
MVLARVLGTVVASRKAEGAMGWKLLLVSALDDTGKPVGGPFVATDVVGAGESEIVLVASGSSARQTTATDQKPCDAVVMAIVDSWDVNNEIRWRKGRDGTGD